MNASQTLSDEIHPQAVGASRTRPAAPTSDGSAPREFSIAIGRALGTVVVTIHGDIDTTNARHLEEILADLIDNQENLRVVIDLHDVAHLDPAGVTALLVATNHAHQRGGAFTVNKASDAVYQSLEGAALVGTGMADVISLSDHSGLRRPTAARPAPPPHPPEMDHHPSTAPPVARPGPMRRLGRAHGCVPDDVSPPTSLRPPDH